ncbi:hypothetical protein ACRALDRAFT_209959 [Sodiomyces alcalophilus JCM 7366]|uniref:uncharacterized protein n=1 Tax=Sodiomyces alcalophilus JCM 7366 TaxID=591952 RepID=UPI0039B427CF
MAFQQQCLLLIHAYALVTLFASICRRRRRLFDQVLYDGTLSMQCKCMSFIFVSLGDLNPCILTHVLVWPRKEDLVVSPSNHLTGATGWMIGTRDGLEAVELRLDITTHTRDTQKLLLPTGVDGLAVFCTVFCTVFCMNDEYLGEVRNSTMPFLGGDDGFSVFNTSLSPSTLIMVEIGPFLTLNTPRDEDRSPELRQGGRGTESTQFIPPFITLHSSTSHFLASVSFVMPFFLPP